VPADDDNKRLTSCSVRPECVGLVLEANRIGQNEASWEISDVRPERRGVGLT